MSGAREPEMIEIQKLGNNLKKSETNKNINNNGLFHVLLASLKEKLSVVNIRTSTLHLLIKYVMEEIEDTHIKGAEQKDIQDRFSRVFVFQDIVKALS